MTKIKGLHFQPWVGDKYDQKGRILLVGESHYMGEEPSEEDDFSKGYDTFTQDIVREYHLAEEEIRSPFYKNTGLLFYPNDCIKVWKEVAFANAMQIGLAYASSEPSKEVIDTIAPAFTLLLDSLKPRKVIVLSKRMFYKWIPENNGEHVTPLHKNGKKTNVWKYTYKGGTCLAMGIAHPSRLRSESIAAWSTVIGKFLSMDMQKN